MKRSPPPSPGPPAYAGLVSATGLGPDLQRPPEVVEVLGKAAVVEILDEARLSRSFFTTAAGAVWGDYRCCCFSRRVAFPIPNPFALKATITAAGQHGGLRRCHPRSRCCNGGDRWASALARAFGVAGAPLLSTPRAVFVGI